METIQVDLWKPIVIIIVIALLRLVFDRLKYARKIKDKNDNIYRSWFS